MRDGTVTVQTTTDTRQGASEGMAHRAEHLLERAGILADQDTHKAVSLLHEAQSLLRMTAEEREPLTHRLSMARCLTTLSKCYERHSDYDAAWHEAQVGMRLLEESLPLTSCEAEKNAVLNGIADVCAVLGNVCDRRADFAAAMEYRRRNLDIVTQLGEQQKRGHALLQNASTYYRIGDFESSLSYYLEALGVFQDTSDAQGHGSAWNGIGNVQFSQREYTAARDSYQKGLMVFKEADNPYWQAGLLGNLAGVLMHLDDLKGARHCYEQSMMLRETISDRHGQAFALNGLADVHLRLGEVAEAHEKSKRAIRLLQDLGDKAMLANAHCVLARACRALGAMETALDSLTVALDLAERVEVRELMYQVHLELSKLHEQRGDSSRALYHHKRYHEEKEALFDEERERKMRNLQVRHQVEQAKREADIYRRLNTELEKANARQAELLEQLQRQSEQLARQARTDSLTGLTNRRYLEAALGDAFGQARLQCRPLTVAIADIDLFKQINDRFSHGVGDMVLRTVARLLQQNCRRDDVLSRYGGEEFVLVLPEATKQDAIRLCERMRELVEQHDWERIHPGLSVTMSFGLCDDTGLEDAERMLSCADTRLYKAKEAGRNRVCCS
jgi:diguanylate cyclase (GGDEF)-like protein